MPTDKNDDMVKFERKSSIKNEDNKTKSDRSKALRILIVEPKGKYCKTVWCAIGIGFTHLLLGATVMTVLMYSIYTEDLHVGVCSIGVILKMYTIILDPGGHYWEIIIQFFLIGFVQIFTGVIAGIVLLYSIQTDFYDVHIFLSTCAYHFFSAQAILSLNYANGWSSPLRLRHRRFAHVFLQMCALFCAIIGFALITIDKGFSFSAHGISGILTTLLAIISFLSGPCALFGGNYLKLTHVTFGMPTFLMSSICFCFGVFTTAFKIWAGEVVVFILLIFVIYYTSFILINCFMKCVMKL